MSYDSGHTHNVRFRQALVPKALFDRVQTVSKSSSVELVPATPDDETTIANLRQLYLHDLSELLDIEPGPDGHFGDGPLPDWWCDPGLHPFLIRRDGLLAGYVLVWRGSMIADLADRWDMREFFIVRKFRTYGVASSAARRVWERFHGEWEIRVLEQNIKAFQFWTQAVSEFTGQPVSSRLVERNSRRMNVFSLRTSARV